jgi:hypothetical protein
LKKMNDPDMAALTVHATAPLRLDAMLYLDTVKLLLWLSMYVYPLEPTRLITINQSTAVPVGMKRGGGWKEKSNNAPRLHKWVDPLPSADPLGEEVIRSLLTTIADAAESLRTHAHGYHQGDRTQERCKAHVTSTLWEI